MSKIGVVKKGWKLLSVLSVRVEPAKFYTGKYLWFEASVMSPDGQTVVQPGGWRGGERWSHANTPLAGQSGV